MRRHRLTASRIAAPPGVPGPACGERHRPTVRTLSTSGGCTWRCEDWFLTAQERANPASELPVWTEGNRAEPLIHGAAYFDRLVTEVEALRGRRPPLLHRLARRPRPADAPRRPDRGRVVRAGRPSAACVVKGLIWRSHLDKLPYSEEENRNLSETVSRSRRRGAARPAGPARRLAPPEAGRAAASGTPRTGTSPSPAASTCATAAGTTPTHRGDPQPVPMSAAVRRAPAVARRPAGAARPGGRRAGHRVPGALDRPDAAGLGEPAGLPARPAARRGPAARSAAGPATPTRRPAGPHRIQVLRTYPAVRPRYPFAPDGERTVARGYTKAVRRARRLIYLEDQYLWSTEVADLFAARPADQPRAAPGRRGAPAPGRGRPARPAAQPGRPRAGAGAVQRAGGGPGARLRRGEPRRATRSTCTPRSASSTTSGPASAATTSTAAPGPTTASCPAPCWTTAGTSGPRRPGRARRRCPGLRP